MSSTGSKFEVENLSIEQVFKDFYVVPDFQREYVWERGHVERLLDDVNNSIDEEDSSDYFLGSMVVYTDEKKEKQYHIIDGQQRITTIYLIFLAANNILGDKATDVLRNKIHAFNRDKVSGKDVASFRLEIQYNDNKEFIKSIFDNKQDKNSKRKQEQRILDAYDTICEFLGNKFDNNSEEIIKWLGNFYDNVYLIHIKAPDLSSAYTIFETINSTGVGLGPMDLLKNLLFRKAKEIDQDKLKEIWKDIKNNIEQCNEKPLSFLRYHIFANSPSEILWGDKGVHKKLRGANVNYDWIRTNSKALRIDDHPLMFAEKLLESSQAYSGFVQCRDVENKEHNLLSNISMLGGSAFKIVYILLLAGRHLRGEQFNTLCRAIENCLLFSFVIREKTQARENFYVRWAQEIQKIDSDEELNQFIETHIKKYMRDNKSDFNYRFRELSESNFHKYRIKYILYKIEQYIGKTGGFGSWNKKLDDYKYDIEHILPQKKPQINQFDKPDEYDTYLHKLGNLTLLTKSENSIVSNMPYEKKKTKYEKCGALLTQSLVKDIGIGKNTKMNKVAKDLKQFEVWDSQAIENRQEMLYQLALKVWEITLK